VKKAVFVLLVGFGTVFFGFAFRNRGVSWMDQALWETKNPFRIVLCVTEDLRTSMAVNFELKEDVPGFVEYRLSGETLFSRSETREKTVRVGTTQVYFRECDLLDLLPGTIYEYRVGGGDQVSEIYRFKTMDPDPSAVSFLVLSDPQGSDRLDYETFANNVLRVINDSGKSPDLAIITGDVVNRDESRTQWNWFIQSLSVIALEIPIAISIGNHETGSFTDPQIRSIEFSGYFHFPLNGPVYQTFDTVEGDQRLFDFDLGKTFSFDAGPAHFVAIDSEFLNNPLDEDNFGIFSQWLETDLAPHSDDWVVAFLHRGPYSLHYDSQNVKDLVVPLLEKYGTDLVLSGHDHRYSRAVYFQDRMVDLSALGSGGLNDYSFGEGTTYLVGNSAGVKFYDHRDDNDTQVAFRYDEKNPVIPWVEITGSSIQVTSYMVDRSDWVTFYPDRVSVIDTFVIRP